MDFIPLNIVSGYRGSVAAGRNFWEGKHQNNSHIPVSDAIVALYQDETARITSAFLITKRLDNFSITKHETLTPILWVPASHAPATVNSILAAVNGFFRFMGWKDIAVKLLKIQKALFCDERRELTRAEYARLVSAAQKVGNERLSLVMQTICATGIRVSELGDFSMEYDLKTPEQQAEVCNVVRFAIDRSRLTKEHLDYVIAAVKALYEDRENIPNMRIVWGHNLPMRHFHAFLEPYPNEEK